jgi:formylglycine-generating enzyme required for sulfatase activity
MSIQRSAARRHHWIAAIVALLLGGSYIGVIQGGGGLDPHEVTNAQYARFIAETGREPPPHWQDHAPPHGRSGEPVVMVNWYDAVAYCGWDSHKKLPTAAEWQAACQAGELHKLGSVWEWTTSTADGHGEGKILCGPRGTCACGHIYDPSWHNMVKGFRCTSSQPLAWRLPQP